MAKIRTFIDSGVLIAFATGRDNVWRQAFDVLDDPEREFTTSDFVRLETLPKARYQHREAEVRIYEEFFRKAAGAASTSKHLVDQAQAEAEASGLSAVDALHIAAAMVTGSDEIITSEKPSKPIFRTGAITVKTIRPT